MTRISFVVLATSSVAGLAGSSYIRPGAVELRLGPGLCYLEAVFAQAVLCADMCRLRRLCKTADQR